MRFDGRNLAVLAKENRWQGAIIFGCVRDSVELMNTDIGYGLLALHLSRARKLIWLGKQKH